MEKENAKTGRERAEKYQLKYYFPNFKKSKNSFICYVIGAIYLLQL